MEKSAPLQGYYGFLDSRWSLEMTRRGQSDKPEFELFLYMQKIGLLLTEKMLKYIRYYFKEVTLCFAGLFIVLRNLSGKAI